MKYLPSKLSLVGAAAFFAKVVFKGEVETAITNNRTNKNGEINASFKKQKRF